LREERRGLRPDALIARFEVKAIERREELEEERIVPRVSEMEVREDSLPREKWLWLRKRALTEGGWGDGWRRLSLKGQ
jgi:hypothetical protein